MLLGSGARIGMGQIIGRNIPLIAIATVSTSTIAALTLAILHNTPLKTSNEEDIKLTIEKRKQKEELEQILPKRDNDNSQEDLENAVKMISKKGKSFKGFSFQNI